MEGVTRRDRLTTALRAHRLGVDVALTAVLAAPLLLSAASSQISTDLPLSAALLVPLALRRTAPVPAAAVVCAAGLVEVVVSATFLAANVAAPVMVHALAAYAPRWAGRAGLLMGLVGALLAALRYYGTGGLETFVLSAVAIAVTVVASWAFGDLKRTRLREVAALVDRTRLLERERDGAARLAASDERARIARELHDVVAHSLSVVVAQADGGRYAGRTDAAAATGALEAISATGRQALADMRSLLGVLREDGRREVAPQPDVASIPRLVGDVRDSGLDVELAVEGEPRQLAPGPGLAAYRIVQESLTNVLKHAGPAVRARVVLTWLPDRLELSVRDDGRGAAARSTPDAPGQGLLGMLQRAEVHGGRLSAGPRAGGGFEVDAVLPLAAQR